MKLNYSILLAGLFLLTLKSFGQESDTPFSRSSIKTGVGIGLNSGKRETGMGILYALGYQKSFWKDRLRVNPNLMLGNFQPYGISDTRDQFYNITTLGINIYLDAIKYKAASLFVATGPFVNYSRGLLGTGGEIANLTSEYFNNLYYGGYLGGGIRISPPKWRLAFEILPLNLQFGNKDFVLVYLKFGIDVKLGGL